MSECAVVFPQFEQPYIIAAHDAGAANLIQAWAKFLPTPVALCTAGPARSRLEGIWSNVPELALPEVLDRIRVVLSGTGGGDFEFEVRRQATSRSIRTVAVLDHYANWESRFRRDGTEVLPDQIIVADEVAESRARETFPKVRVERWPNLYLQGEVARVHAFGAVSFRTPPLRILVAIEPIAYCWEGDGGRLGEFVVIDYLLDNLNALGVESSEVEVRLRPHPSDPPGKYHEVLRRHENMRVHIAPPAELADDIAWSDMVAGTNSFAMVVALHAGRPTICILPPPAPRCILPFEGITHLRDLVGT